MDEDELLPAIPGGVDQGHHPKRGREPQEKEGRIACHHVHAFPGQQSRQADAWLRVSQSPAGEAFSQTTHGRGQHPTVSIPFHLPSPISHQPTRAASNIPPPPPPGPVRGIGIKLYFPWNFQTRDNEEDGLGRSDWITPFKFAASPSTRLDHRGAARPNVIVNFQREMVDAVMGG